MKGLYDIIMAIISIVPWIAISVIVHDFCNSKPKDLEITYGDKLHIHIRK